jgi:predicted dehydrogenase
VRTVAAVGLSVLGGHEDVANARLEFQDGCVAVLSASRVSCEAARRMHVWTPRAFATVDFAARTSTLVRPDDAVVRGRVDLDALACQDPDNRQRALAGLLPREERRHEPVDTLVLELTDFVQSIRDGRAPRVPGEQGRDAVALAERVLEKIAAHAWNGQPDGSLKAA